MKKVYFMSMALAAMLAMAGCSNDDIAGVGGDDATTTTLAEGEGIVAINLSNTGIGTRAARPLGSSAAANNVNKVQLKVYKYEGNAWTLATGVGIKDEADLILDWTAPTTGEDPNKVPTEGVSETGNTTQKDVTLTGLEAYTKYKVVAYGYNAASGDAPAFTPTDNQGSFTVNNMTKEEVFAGQSSEVTTTGEAKFPGDVTVKMDRHVAGMLAYMTGIPTRAENKETSTEEVIKFVVVKSNANSTGITFPSTADYNGVSCTEGATTLLTFDMSKIALNWNNGNPAENAYQFANYRDGVANEEPAPFANDYTAPEGLRLKSGSIFGACYLLPYDKNHTNGDATLTIELQNASGKALVTKKVVTDKASSSVDEHHYDIRRNNFYSIGQKLYTNNDGGDPDPEDPENPEPENPEDEDDPVNVGDQSEKVILIINDAWSVLHNMGLE